MIDQRAPCPAGAPPHQRALARRINEDGRKFQWKERAETCADLGFLARVEHDYLASDIGARIVKDAQILNNALGYEMNTIEFAVQGGIPYAIDFLNPAPDFERDRITPHYFELVLDKMSALVIDRALHGRVQQTWPRWAQMIGLSDQPPTAV